MSKRNEEYSVGEILSAVPFFSDNSRYNSLYELVSYTGSKPVRMKPYRELQPCPVWDVKNIRTKRIENFYLFEENTFAEDDFLGGELL